MGLNLEDRPDDTEVQLIQWLWDGESVFRRGLEAADICEAVDFEGTFSRQTAR